MILHGRNVVTLYNSVNATNFPEKSLSSMFTEEELGPE
jgi:hypothetical protein